MSSPVASVEITASSRSLSARLREARAKFGTFADGVRNELNKVSMGSGVGKDGFGQKFGAQFLGNLASAGAQKALGFMEDMGRATYDFQDKLKRLQITAEATPADMAQLAETIRKASDATGLSKASILEASSAYVALTGDMETAQASTMTWARVAQATNTTIADISSTAAAMTQQLKITPAEMEAAFSSLAIQGKKGAIELKDLAGLMSQIAPQWAMFGKGTGITGVRELGAALQVVKRGFGGDAGETVTGLQSLLTAIVKNSARFESSGIKIFDKKKGGGKEMRDVLDIVDSIAKSDLVKDPTKMEKAFGRVEAYRAFLQLSQNRDMVKDLVVQSQDATVIQKDLDTYMQSTAGKTGQAWEQAKNRIAEMFTPERIAAFADVAVGLAGALATIAEKIAGILGTAKGLGVGMARVIGGDSEEDRISRLRASRLEERVNTAAFAYRKAHPNATSEEADAAGMREIGGEDTLRSRLYAQNRGETFERTDTQAAERNMARSQMAAISPFLTSMLGARESTSRGKYSFAELAALSQTAAASTDSGQIVKQLTVAIKAALQDNLKVTLQISEDIVAKASAKAPAHRNGVKQ